MGGRAVYFGNIMTLMTRINRLPLATIPSKLSLVNSGIRLLGHNEKMGRVWIAIQPKYIVRPPLCTICGRKTARFFTQSRAGGEGVRPRYWCQRFQVVKTHYEPEKNKGI
jgi:hypothetical protein